MYTRNPVINNITTAKLDVCLKAFFFTYKPNNIQAKDNRAKNISGINIILKTLFSICQFIICND